MHFWWEKKRFFGRYLIDYKWQYIENSIVSIFFSLNNKHKKSKICGRFTVDYYLRNCSWLRAMWLRTRVKMVDVDRSCSVKRRYDGDLEVLSVQLHLELPFSLSKFCKRYWWKWKFKLKQRIILRKVLSDLPSRCLPQSINEISSNNISNWIWIHVR